MILRSSFGSLATGVSWFSIRYDGDRLPSWSAPAVNARTFVIPGSFPPVSETQIVSIGPSTVQWRLWFPTLDDYWAMLAKLGTVDTLTVPLHVQSHRGTVREDHGLQVVALPSTLLLALDADTPEIDGDIEAVATFQRHIDPVTGLAVSA